MSSRQTKPQWDPYVRTADEHRLSQEDQNRRKQMLRDPMVKRVGRSSSVRTSSTTRSVKPEIKSIGVPEVNEDGDFTYHDMQLLNKLKAELGQKAEIRNNYLASRGIFFTQSPSEESVEEDAEDLEEREHTLGYTDTSFMPDDVYQSYDKDAMTANITPLKKWVEDDVEQRPQLIQSDGKKINMTPIPQHLLQSGQQTSRFSSPVKFNINNVTTNNNQNNNISHSNNIKNVNNVNNKNNNIKNTHLDQNTLEFILQRQEELFTRVERLEAQQRDSVSRTEIQDMIDRAVSAKQTSLTAVVKETATGVLELESLPSEVEQLKFHHQADIRELQMQVENQTMQFQNQLAGQEQVRLQMNTPRATEVKADIPEKKPVVATKRVSISSRPVSVASKPEPRMEVSKSISKPAVDPVKSAVAKPLTSILRPKSGTPQAALLPTPSFEAMDLKREEEERQLAKALEDYSAAMGKPTKTVAPTSVSGIPTFTPLSSAPTPREPLYNNQQRPQSSEDKLAQAARMQDGELRSFPLRMLALPMRKDVSIE